MPERRTAEMIIAHARAMIGTRFVAQGRDPAIGLDCVGLIIAAFGLDAANIRDDYRLAGDHGAAILGVATQWFRRVGLSNLRGGDMIVMKAGDRQWHLAVWTGVGMAHADARRRMVVDRPGPPEWPFHCVLRLRSRRKRMASWRP